MGMESLEGRTLFSATITETWSGYYYVQGTDGPDAIRPRRGEPYRG